MPLNLAFEFFALLDVITVCPKCDVALVLMEFDEIEIDFCPNCQGIWLDAGELEDLIARTGATTGDPLVDFRDAQPERPRTRDMCPRCDRRMRQVIKSCSNGNELCLDTCPRGHGLWFDTKELNQLLHSFPIECGTAKTVEYLAVILGESFGSKPVI